jgi:catechol 2,3-dioxygenase-like lactoylglutathione lyase family enzyme
VCLDAKAARKLFCDALGAEELEGEDEQLACRHEGAVTFVDARQAKNAPLGFLPLFLAEELEPARAHFRALGSLAEPLPWSPEAAAFLVRGPQGASFCVGAKAAIVAMRAVAQYRV